MLKHFLLCCMMLIGLSSSSLIAQSNAPCGSADHPEWDAATVERIRENKELIRKGLVTERSAITYVPVKFHLVARADGTGRIGESNVLAMLCRMNEDFLDQEIQFFISGGFSYIDHDQAFTSPSSFAGGLEMRSERADGHLNIYICQTADTAGPGGPGGTTLGYYDRDEDWLVLRKQEVSYSSATVPHELGHYFTLAHTHRGWDGEPYDESMHGNPAPTLSPSGIPTENQARTGSCKNCEEAGDLLCDTPPDYNFGFGWPDCDYDAGTMDPCGDIVDPMEINMMGYFLNCTGYIFTEEQKQLMNADLTRRMNLNANNQEYINPNLNPSNTTIITEKATLEIPANGEALSFKNIYFDWSAVPGADGYILEVDRISSFALANQVFLITDGSSNFELEVFPNLTYYWRVTPYNEYSSCIGTSEVSSFTAGEAVSTNEIASVSTWSLSPNPVSGNTVNLMLDSSERFNANIQVYAINGQLVNELQNKVFNIGTNNIEIPIGDVENGTYLVRIQSENGVINTKIVVAK